MGDVRRVGEDAAAFTVLLECQRGGPHDGGDDRMPDPQEQRLLSIGAAVRFVHNGETIDGHLVQRQRRRRFATVIDAGERLWSVPESVLTASGGVRRTVIVTRHDEARADYRVGDAVIFAHAGGTGRGTIVKLNPKRATVRCGARCWNVSYDRLDRMGGEHRRNGAERLNAVAGMARRLMDEHGLTHWTLTFVEAGRRCGDCCFRDRVIRISRTHAVEGSDGQIRDTVLHEIAHAIAGRAAGHGPVWKAAARRIGATPTTKGDERQPR